jgi:hypothetical protein
MAAWAKVSVPRLGKALLRPSRKTRSTARSIRTWKLRIRLWTVTPRAWASGMEIFCTACCSSTPEASSFSTRSARCSSSKAVALLRDSQFSSRRPMRSRAWLE